ncbi:hypothetical protein GCM10020220_066540 [Nonomuraea rubra]|uniref:hypothetical protein n=1 Tax=Nonomuraea rubra TaxID=46180 RepID=UPI0031E63E2F
MNARLRLPLVYATMHCSWGWGFLTSPRKLAGRRADPVLPPPHPAVPAAGCRDQPPEKTRSTAALNRVIASGYSGPNR